MQPERKHWKLYYFESISFTHTEVNSQYNKGTHGEIPEICLAFLGSCKIKQKGKMIF